MTLMDDAISPPAAEKIRLIELAQQGDRDAFTHLFQRYHAQICTYLGRLLENEELGRDHTCSTPGVRMWAVPPCG